MTMKYDLHTIFLLSRFIFFWQLHFVEVETIALIYVPNRVLVVPINTSQPLGQTHGQPSVRAYTAYFASMNFIVCAIQPFFFCRWWFWFSRPNRLCWLIFIISRRAFISVVGTYCAVHFSSLRRKKEWVFANTNIPMKSPKPHTTEWFSSH